MGRGWKTGGGSGAASSTEERDVWAAFSGVKKWAVAAVVGLGVRVWSFGFGLIVWVVECEMGGNLGLLDQKN